MSNTIAQIFLKKVVDKLTYLVYYAISTVIQKEVTSCYTTQKHLFIYRS